MSQIRYRRAGVAGKKTDEGGISYGSVFQRGEGDLLRPLRPAHRGQESAGISVYDGKVVRTHKAMGLVAEVFNNPRIEALGGPTGVGHVRYSTTGESALKNSQPILVKYKESSVAIAHNGNLVNAGKLKEELEAEGEVFHSTSDTEVMARLFVRAMMVREDPAEAVREIMRKAVGSYSIVLLMGNTVIAARDPLGIKPLCVGKTDTDVIVASESAAIDTLNGKLVRDVRPGEMVVAEDGVVRFYQLCPPPMPRPLRHALHLLRPARAPGSPATLLRTMTQK